MDRRERIPGKSKNALLVAIKAAFDAFQGDVWTALPAQVSSFNAAAMTVEAQTTIQAQIHQPDGTWVDTTLPPCLDCPVMFPGGGGFVWTFPLVKGDEGLLVFASRCIDSWWQSGGVQSQAELRMHDLSDGFFFPTGGLSQPNIPAGGASTTNAQLRLKSGALIMDVTPEGVTTFPQPVVMTNAVTISGDVGGQVGGGGTVNFGNAVVKSTATAQIADIETSSLASVNAHVHDDPQGGETGPAKNP